MLHVAVWWVRFKERNVGVWGDNKLRVSVGAHVRCWTVGGSFSWNTELCVCMSEARARLTHRVLLPPTGQTKNRNTPTHFFFLCVCMFVSICVCLWVKEKVNNAKKNIWYILTGFYIIWTTDLIYFFQYVNDIDDHWHTSYFSRLTKWIITFKTKNLHGTTLATLCM